MNRLGLTVAVVLVSIAGPAWAHETRPSYLSLHEDAPHRFSVLWKRPKLSGEPVDITPVFPAHCAASPVRARGGELAVVERWTIDCGDQGLVSSVVSFDGLERASDDVLLRVELLDGTTRTWRVGPAEPSARIEGRPSRFDVVHTYLVLGIEHILLGIDHLLFVLGLLLLVGSFRGLIATVTAFTAAHSITLALASLNVIHVPGPPVEAIIALSIVFLAFEILHGDPNTVTRKRPWIVAFTFGLLHGLGFAGALAEIGLPPSDVPLALFTFNVGVETGQLIFIGFVFAVRWLLLKLPNRETAWVKPAIAYAIGGLASFWLIERVAGF